MFPRQLRVCFDFCIFELAGYVLLLSRCRRALVEHVGIRPADSDCRLLQRWGRAWRRGYSGLSMLAAINQRARILKWQRIVVSYLDRQVLAIIEHLWNIRETRYYNSLLDERLEDLHGDEVWSD